MNRVLVEATEERMARYENATYAKGLAKMSEESRKKLSQRYESL
jgi:hypothetical protein